MQLHDFQDQGNEMYICWLDSCRVPRKYRIFLLSGMATVYPTDLFFGQWRLCTLLAGSILSLFHVSYLFSLLKLGKKLYLTQ